MCFAPYLIRRTAPGTRKQKSVCIATFVRLGAVAWLLHRKSRRKSAVHQSRSGSLSPCQSGKGSLIEKKLQKCPIFCFCNRRIAETRQIRNKYLASAELGAREPDGSQAESQEGDGAIDLWRYSSAAVPHVWGCRLPRASVKQHPNSAHGAK